MHSTVGQITRHSHHCVAF